MAEAMASEHLNMKRIVMHKWFLPTVTSLTALYFCKRLFYNKLYAFAIKKIAKSMAASRFINGIKQKLFSPLFDGYTDSENGKTLTIVEIGAGSGTNFKFYPEGSSVICVEPKSEFEGYLNAAAQENGKHLKSVRFVQGRAETLATLLEENYADCVVCTLVLCSVEDLERSAHEIKKILKPGGIFLFLEHVHAPPAHRLTRFYQSLITPPYKVIADNCHFNREPWIQFEAAGFSQFEYEIKQHPKAQSFSPIKWLSFGTATK